MFLQTRYGADVLKAWIVAHSKKFRNIQTGFNIMELSETFVALYFWHQFNRINILNSIPTAFEKPIYLISEFD